MSGFGSANYLAPFGAKLCTLFDLAKSKCKRMLHGNGLLTEIAELDGSRKGLSRDDLDRFVASFPVEAA